MLSTFFGMLALWAYVAWVRRPSYGRYLGVLLLLAMSLMAKPMLVTLPITLLLLDLWPLQRGPAGIGPEQRRVWFGLLREKLPIFALVVVFSIVNFLAQRGVGAVGDLRALPIPNRVANAFLSYITYIGKMCWPTSLAAFYPFPAQLDGLSISNGDVITAILGLTLISALVFGVVRRHAYLCVGWLWYLGTLLPVIGLVQAGGQARADRFTYVPLIGLFVMVAWGGAHLLARFRVRGIAPVTAGAILILCAVTSRAQLQYWKDSSALWTRVLQFNPDNQLAHNYLGQALRDEGRYDEAVVHFNRSLELLPADADAQNNFANELIHHGMVAEAITHYTEAIRINPGLAEAHNNMANALMRQNRVAEALAHYSEAIRINPELAEAHNGLAALLLNQGKNDEAFREFSEAVRTAPNNPDFHFNLGVMFKKQGQIDEARGQFTTALQLNPGHQQAQREIKTLNGGVSTAGNR